ncbi:MAG: arsenate reductase family protein [Pyrinomonadaceae bacterium]
MTKKTVEVYGIPHCTTCQKALAYLESKGVEVSEFHNIKEEKLGKREVEKLAAGVGGANQLFSKRAMKYRAMGLEKRELKDSELIDLMTDEYTFIRRPVVISDEFAIAGFSKKKYDEFL